MGGVAMKKIKNWIPKWRIWQSRTSTKWK